MKHKNQVEIRAELFNRLKTELIGPGIADEVLDERPSERYLTGILWPAGQSIDSDDDESIMAGYEGEETGMPETVAPLLHAMKPSAVGLSFLIESGVKTLKASVSWAVYRRTPENRNKWMRLPCFKNVDFNIDLKPGTRKSYTLSSEYNLVLEWITRTVDNRTAVSIFVANRQEKPESGIQDEYCIFQPVLKISGNYNKWPFSSRIININDSPYKSSDFRSDELLYRDVPVFSVGHGTAADWGDISPDKCNAGYVQTAAMPYHEVPMVIPPAPADSDNYDMLKLADATDSSEVYDMLKPLCDDYGTWIKSNEELIDTLPENLIPVAESHIAGCKASHRRISKGLEIINDTDNPRVFEAFKFMNKSMYLQRYHTVWSKECRKKNEWTDEKFLIKAQWRPFQIAFILQSLGGIAEPENPDRNITDLLWFPTGGGKTEAYLGLAAFTMALRRISNHKELRCDTGVTVLMRYTLRLLTIQQFQRAATLVCACETIRLEEPEIWGKTPFRIGLWVGAGSTPNNFDDCYTYLHSVQEPSGQVSPVQLVNCPWCGATLSRRNYYADAGKRRVIIGCSRKECEFHRTNNSEGIPALVEDEEIYRLLPSLIIGTVDKFARMPWVGEIGAIFGQVEGEIPGWGFTTGSEPRDIFEKIRIVADSKIPEVTDRRKIMPPELIIQDELHLISGPLGTLVGIYETAIDKLCSYRFNDKSVYPKIVASTATIRRAEHQVRNLFNRQISIFPSPGINAGDSYFARTQNTSDVPGRIYAGVFAPGKSIKTALIRVYAAMLASTGMIDHSEEDKDPYQTLVGYFNSLRELGGAVRIVEDDVRSRINVLAKRTGGKYMYKNRELSKDIQELTSRVDSSQIPEILEVLERRFVNISDSKRPADIVLASNMISVGVDIDRLGLMVVTGQPKSTAEYIQTTSRVGREYPGLIITVYNWARPRDISHYERFRSYHEALYRYVEAISVTPFSSRARDRALAATIVSLWRLGVPGKSGQSGAQKFNANSDEAIEIRDHIIERTSSIDSDKRANEVRTEIQSIYDRWSLETDKRNLTYSRVIQNAPRLIYHAGKKETAIFPVPNSMREVEPSVGIFIKRGDN